MTKEGSEPDQVAEQLTRMLTDLADDPDAPASTVTARSVLEAARTATADPTAVDSAAVDPTAVDSGAVDSGAAAGSPTAPPLTAPRKAPQPDSVGELHVLAARADAARTRATRRRTALFSLAAAAAVAAVAAVVIPLAISGNSTTTSANSAPGAAPAAAAPSEVRNSAAASAAAGAAQSPAQEGAPATEEERPPPGDNALTGTVGADTAAGTAPSAAASAAAGAAAGSSCWPPLPAAAATALSEALPAGAFQSPSTLTAECGPDPVAGAAVSGTVPGTALEVRVAKTDPGACARGSSEAAVRCVPRGAGVYVATDGGGSATAYIYGNGDEVVVGAPVNGGLTPTGSGLSADQTVAAAQAVLAGLG